MTHLNEFCPKSCLFDATNENENKYACQLCWAAEVTAIVPALQATIWGQDGLVLGQYRDQYIVETYMSNGQPTRSGVHKSRVQFK